MPRKHHPGKNGKRGKPRGKGRRKRMQPRIYPIEIARPLSCVPKLTSAWTNELKDYGNILMSIVKYIVGAGTTNGGATMYQPLSAADLLVGSVYAGEVPDKPDNVMIPFEIGKIGVITADIKPESDASNTGGVYCAAFVRAPESPENTTDGNAAVCKYYEGLSYDMVLLQPGAKWARMGDSLRVSAPRQRQWRSLSFANSCPLSLNGNINPMLVLLIAYQNFAKVAKDDDTELGPQRCTFSVVLEGTVECTNPGSSEVLRTLYGTPAAKLAAGLDPSLPENQPPDYIFRGGRKLHRYIECAKEAVPGHDFEVVASNSGMIMET